MRTHDYVSLLDKWDAKLPQRDYLPNGTEKMASRVRRMAKAAELEEAAEAEDPRLADENREKREANAAEANKAKAANDDTQFWNGLPAAMRAMGLGEAQITQLGGLETDWPGMKAVADWRASGKLFLVLGGPPGSGKTLAAARVLLEGGQEQVTCQSYDAPQWRTAWAKFARAADLTRRSFYDKQDRVYLDRLANTKWLVLDDLGAEMMTDPWRQTLLELVDKRMAAGCRTVITTNLDGKAFAERYDVRVMRRLKEFGQFAAVRPLERKAG